MKIAIKILVLILLLLLATVFTAVFLFRNEISAILSIELRKPRGENTLQCGIYEMTFNGNYYFEDYLEQGGAKDDRELLDFIMKKMTKGLVPVKINASKIGCSSFTAKKSDGQRLFARNYDLYSTNTCLVRVRGNKKRHASISTVDLSFINIPASKNVDSLALKALCLAAPYVPLDGINDAGVSCALYMTYQGDGKKVVATNQNTDLKDLSSTTFIRMLLDYADSLEEAVKIASQFDMHDSAGTSFHYMVADSSGRSAILEWVNAKNGLDGDGSLRKLVVTYNDDDSHIGLREAKADFQWVTNFIIQPGYYEFYDTAHLKGWDRYKIIYDRLSKSGGIVEDEMSAMQVLKMAAQRTIRQNRDAKDTILTVHSAIYNLDEKSVLWCGNEQFSDGEGMFCYKFDAKKRMFVRHLKIKPRMVTISK